MGLVTLTRALPAGSIAANMARMKSIRLSLLSFVLLAGCGANAGTDAIGGGPAPAAAAVAPAHEGCCGSEEAAGSCCASKAEASGVAAKVEGECCSAGEPDATNKPAAPRHQ